MTPFSLGLQVQRVPETDARTFPGKLVNSRFLCVQLDLDRERRREFTHQPLVLNVFVFVFTTFLFTKHIYIYR